MNSLQFTESESTIIFLNCNSQSV